MKGEKYMKFIDLNKEDRPRERMINSGPKSLTDIELLAIILGSGVKNKDVFDISSQVLKEYSFNDLKDLSYQKLIKLNGIKQAKACKILACFEIARRSFKLNDENISLDNSKKIYDYLYHFYYLSTEEKIVVLFMDIKLKVIKNVVYELGNSHSVNLPIREIIIQALNTKCSCVVLSHNHPSNELLPSMVDIDSTLRIKNLLEEINVLLIEHLIVGQNNYYSFNDNGLLIDANE